MKTVVMPEKQRKHRTLHIEVPGAIINIRPYLTTMDGKAVTSIEIIPDIKVPGILPDYPERSGINVRVLHDNPNKFIACGSCGAYHRADFHGDCREDAERFEVIPDDGILV